MGDPLGPCNHVRSHKPATCSGICPRSLSASPGLSRPARSARVALSLPNSLKPSERPGPLGTPALLGARCSPNLLALLKSLGLPNVRAPSPWTLRNSLGFVVHPGSRGLPPASYTWPLGHPAFVFSLAPPGKRRAPRSPRACFGAPATSGLSPPCWRSVLYCVSCNSWTSPSSLGAPAARLCFYPDTTHKLMVRNKWWPKTEAD